MSHIVTAWQIRFSVVLHQFDHGLNSIASMMVFLSKDWTVSLQYTI